MHVDKEAKEEKEETSKCSSKIRIAFDGANCISLVFCVEHTANTELRMTSFLVFLCRRRRQHFFDIFFTFCILVIILALDSINKQVHQTNSQNTVV